MKVLVLVAGVLSLFSASVDADGSRVQGYGLSFSLPGGWVGHARPGEIDAIAPEGAVVQLDEAVVTPQRYLPLPKRVRAGTTRLYVTAGDRMFFLFVHSTPARLPETDRVLSSLRVTPWTAPLAAPQFRSASSWQAGQSGPSPAAGASVSAWASTVAYANSPVDLPPDATLARGDANTVVVWIGLVRPRRSHPFPTRRDPLNLKQAFCTRAWEGAIPGVIQCTLWSHVPHRFEISVYVYLRSRALMPKAQAELRRLVLPRWPRT